MSEFTLEIIQAINDWQRGGDHKQKLRRGARLKDECSKLPQQYRTCDLPCYRQEAHEKDRVWQLLADEMLPETIAAWTTSVEVAKEFKGGVPPDGLQGVIFELKPPPDLVVVNLEAVYADRRFHEACERFRDQVSAYGDGIGRYGDSQAEVVLEISNLEPAQVRHYGGFSSSREEIAEIFFSRRPTLEDLDVFDKLCTAAGVVSGAWWLSPSGTRAVLRRIQPEIDRLRASRA